VLDALCEVAHIKNPDLGLVCRADSDPDLAPSQLVGAASPPLAFGFELINFCGLAAGRFLALLRRGPFSLSAHPHPDGYDNLSGRGGQQEHGSKPCWLNQSKQPIDPKRIPQAEDIHWRIAIETEA
jgi:hypothetical protein